VFQEDRDDGIIRRVVVLVEPEGLEVLILAHKIRWRIRKQGEEPFEVRLFERIVQVFDDVELDAALAQDLDCAARLASARVVIDRDAVHRRFSCFVSESSGA